MQELLENLHHDVIAKILPPAGQIPMQFVYIGGLLIGSVLIIVWMSLIAMGWIWAERRVAGWIQERYGPNRVGPQGLLQSLADGIKLLTKEDIIPTVANRFLYELAPLLVFAGAFIPFVALPFSQHLVIADMDLGLFYVTAFGALEVVGILMAGWAPNSKWTLYGGMRLAAQMLSYEIPLGLSLLVVVILSGTLNISEIVIWQEQGWLFGEDLAFPWPLNFLGWAVFRSPAAFVAFFLFYIAGLAECKRAPFDLPEAESELVSGFHTEYTGIRFSYFFLAEYCAMYVICLLGAAVFLGGWVWPLPTFREIPEAHYLAGVMSRLSGISYDGLGLLDQAKLFLSVIFWKGPVATIAALGDPGVIKFLYNEAAGFINMVGKSFFLIFVMVWIRWTLPRVRIDQVMHLCLKVLLPFGLACVVAAAIQTAITPPSKTAERIRTRAIKAATHKPEPAPAKAAETEKPAAAEKPAETPPAKDAPPAEAPAKH